MAACRLAVLISGRGSNLKAIIDAIAGGDLDADIALVISNRADASGLDFASAAGIDTSVVEHTRFDTREDFDGEMMRQIDAADVDLVILAGFMRMLSSGFISHYRDRILNIHPSLLPDLKGLDTHRRALEAGYREHGASVHFVNEELDSGAVVLQAVVAIEHGDDADSLARRVLQQEHVIYPMTIQWFAEGRLRCDGDKVLLDGEVLHRPLLWKNNALS